MPLETIGAVPASTTGTGLTSDASAGVKGAWAQLSAATTRDTQWVLICLRKPVASTWVALDVGIGAAGAEVVVIPDVTFYRPVASGVNQLACMYIAFPTRIPAGSRVAARIAGQLGSSVASVVFILGSSLPPVNGGGRISQNGGASLTVLATPGTAHTKGSWTELTASTTEDAVSIISAVMNVGTNAVGDLEFLADIAIGPSGAEVPILENFYLANSTGLTRYGNGFPGIIPVFIPKGSRLSARHQSNTTDATAGRLFAGCHTIAAG